MPQSVGAVPGKMTVPGKDLFSSFDSVDLFNVVFSVVVVNECFSGCEHSVI